MALDFDPVILLLNIYPKRIVRTKGNPSLGNSILLE